MSEMPTPEAAYELAPRKRKASWRREREHGALPAAMLAGNALWFCRLRWIVAGFFALFGALCSTGVCGSFSCPDAPVAWPFAVAGLLAAANLAFLSHARRLRKRDGDHSADWNLWTQIVFDLVVLAAVVHFIGSVQTFVAFAFLFHIVLACIFFSKLQSFAVVMLASALYAGCVGLEMTGVLSPPRFYGGPAREAIERIPGAAWVQVGSALAIWIVLWQLTSKLADMVRDRDRELAETNARLIEAQESKTRHMLHTTHELKAPFAAIHANAQLLEKGYCGELPEEAIRVLAKISARAKRLAAEIQEMLQLANIRTVTRGPHESKRIELAELIGRCAALVAPQAENRGIRIDTDLQPAYTVGIEDHLQMLMGNLVSNAVNYSKDGGRVRLTCRAEPGTGARVSVADDGIGIPNEKLPKIFDEHFRTDEAVRHNKESSGLGLAIVREVAQEHGIRLKVFSRVGEGTRFDLRFPPSAGARGGEPREEDLACRTC